jgi:hypothetical protein
MDAGQSYSNDCVLAPDPGSPTHKPGHVAVLNESTHKVVLLISSIPGCSVNASELGVVGAFGPVTFEVVHKGRFPAIESYAATEGILRVRISAKDGGEGGIRTRQDAVDSVLTDSTMPPLPSMPRMPSRLARHCPRGRSLKAVG